MRRNDTDKLARRYNLGLLPETWKVPLVAGYQVIGTSSIGAFQKNIVGGVSRDVERAGRCDAIRVFFDELQ